MKKDRFRLLILSSEQSDSFDESALDKSRQSGSNMGT